MQFEFGPQLPAPLATSVLPFHNEEAKKDSMNGGLSVSAFPKGGKDELHLPTSSARLRLRPGACRHLAPSEAPQTNPIPGVP